MYQTTSSFSPARGSPLGFHEISNYLWGFDWCHQRKGWAAGYRHLWLWLGGRTRKPWKSRHRRSMLSGLSVSKQ